MAEDTLATIDALFGIDPACSLSYRDARRGIAKRVMVEAGVVTGVRLSGETAARGWLKDIMASHSPAEAVRRWMLAPLAAPPVAAATTRGHIVCNCFDVAESEILAAAQQGMDLEQLQARLKCGTSCGSCIPEVKRLITVRKAA